MENSKIGGLKKIWFKNFILPLIVIVVIIGIAISFFIKDYYYSKASEALRIPLVETTEMLGSSFKNSFTQGMSDYVVDQFKYKNNIAIEILDRSGHVLSSSEIRTSENVVDSKDYINALRGTVGYSVYTVNNTGEKIMSYSSPFYVDGMNYGVIRFKISMESVDNIIINRMSIVYIVLVSMVVFSYVMSSLFINSIVRKLNNIVEKSIKIGKGQEYENFDGPEKDEIDMLSVKLDKMGEEIRETQKIKDEFMASVSHELKTPLTSIIGWTDYMLLDESCSQEDIRHNLEIIHNESSRLKDLVEKLLDFSKYQIVDNRFALESFDLSKLIVETLDQLQPIIKSRNFETISNIQSDIDIVSDKNALRQIIINIIDNSLKHSEGSKISVLLECIGSKITLVFKDDGVGINNDDKDKICNSFYSGEDKQGGLGLGLSISRKIIESLNGTINFEIKSGCGTQCIIVFDKMIKKD